MIGFGQASASTHKSDAETQKYLKGEGAQSDSRMYLVNKWLGRVTEEEQSAVQAILDAFEIDMYNATQVLPLRPI